MNAELLDAVQLALTGQAELARQRFGELWATLTPDDCFHRCILAHYMADLQTDPEAELHWDQVALNAALAGSAESFDGHIPGVTRDSFLPSLYLNLAASHERTGTLEVAREHAALAIRAAAFLPATPMGDGTRAAIVRLADRLQVHAD